MANKAGLMTQYYDLIQSEVPFVKAHLNKYVIDDLANIVMEYCECDYNTSDSTHDTTIYLRNYLIDDLINIILLYCKKNNFNLDIPMSFWFNSNPGLALPIPIIALQYNDINIKINTKSI